MIRLDDFYTVDDESACWSLTYRKEGDINPTTGKPSISTDVSYHANLKQALTKYLDESLKGSESLHSVLSRISEVEQRIETLGSTSRAVQEIAATV